ncbi:glycosyltransferase family 39 protein [Paenibacillus filicis]|uniref:Glycosyltransferase family 39 protein n=1 Tax=Paenibacillus gyeongsangnamensis TaxID=3388067 RepID=A0ABT4QAS6_9BACL|nr:glycosyltransferase family 39 protein [Paenibacillus filicis]MCZ8513993.1 glycosyltransferase family 39 protein [Paenibacillus filicis]
MDLLLLKYKDSAYRLLQKYKDRDFIYYIPFILLSLDARLSYFFYLLRPGNSLPQSEDSQWYIDYAYALMNHFNIGLHMNDIMYLGYNVLLALLLAAVKDPVSVIFIQAVVASLSIILVFKIARMLFNRSTAILAAYFYYDLWDMTLWSTYILTETFFITLLLLNVYFLLMALKFNKSVYKILFVASGAYMLIFRPTGLVSFLFILIYIVINLDRAVITGFLRKYGWIIGGSIASMIAALAFVYSLGKLDPLLASMQFNAKKVLYNIYANGWIYDKPSPYDHKFKPNYTINIGNSLIASFIVNNWDNVLVIYGKRTIAFLGRWVWQTDLHTKRGVLRIVHQLLPTLLFVTGTVAAIAGKRFRKASVLWLIILAVYLFCIVFFIDFMYRYKAPGMPFIVIVVAYGANRVIYWALSIANKYSGMLLYGTRKPAKKNTDRYSCIQ